MILLAASCYITEECRHAAIRRLAVATSVQTWVSSLEKVSAEWSIRQVLEAQHHEDFFAGKAKSGNDRKGSAAEAGAGTQPESEAVRKEKKGRTGGFGGAWRAYVHLNYAGRRLSKWLLKDLGAEFRSLTVEDKAFYENIGSKATLASRAGFKSFGERVRPLSDEDPTLAGALDSGDALLPHSSAHSHADLVPHCAMPFEIELRKLNRSSRKQASQTREKMREQEKRRLEHQQQVLSDLDAVVSGVPAEQSCLALRSLDQTPPDDPDPDETGEAAHEHMLQEVPARPDLVAVSWCPPSVDVAKAEVSKVRVKYVLCLLCVVSCLMCLMSTYVLCFVMLCYVMLCYVMLCYVMLCYVMLCYVMLCYVMLCYVMLCYVMLCYVMLCYVMLCYVMLCYVMLCYVMLCYVMLCYVMLCYVMLCYVILCYVMSFYVTCLLCYICYVMSLVSRHKYISIYIYVIFICIV